MGLGKTVLLFQAFITLIISLVFFSQVISLDKAKISDLNIKASDSIFPSENIKIIDLSIKDRYKTASFILFIISVIEICLILFYPS